jgi:hypothetical protein
VVSSVIKKKYSGMAFFPEFVLVMKKYPDAAMTRMTIEII